jgi:hypothetical protein
MKARANRGLLQLKTLPRSILKVQRWRDRTEPQPDRTLQVAKDGATSHRRAITSFGMSLHLATLRKERSVSGCPRHPLLYGPILPLGDPTSEALGHRDRRLGTSEEDETVLV